MYFELKATVLLKQSLHYLDIPERIGNWLGRAELNDSLLKQDHYARSYKLTVFDFPYPREKDGVYKQGRVYVIVIRSSVENRLRRIAAALQQMGDDSLLELLSLSTVREKRYKHITELVTVTPAILTVDSKPWVPGGDLEFVISRLHANAEKKFNQLYPDEPVRQEEPFVEGMQVLNEKPVAYRYKGRKLLGNKFRLLIRSDEGSQKLAAVVMGAGLSEKNGILGAGFCLARGLE